jgi:hypothetical protein
MVILPRLLEPRMPDPSVMKPLQILLFASRKNGQGVRDEREATMKSWLGVGLIIFAVVVGGVALISDSLLLWAATGLLLVGGVAVERDGGWGSDATDSQHPLEVLLGHEHQESQ